jgi:hypothetical protein
LECAITAIESVAFSVHSLCCMPKSPYVAALDTVQQALTSFLRPLGFRRKGRSFNRRVTDGLVHVVTLQMGEYPIGDYVIPEIRESFYGRFTANLGVFLPGVRSLEHHRPAPQFLREYDCDIRQRLSVLAYSEDRWWDLDHAVAETASEIVRLMDGFGVPFLERFENCATVLNTIDSEGELPFCNAGRSALVGALLSVHFGQKDRAAGYFERAAQLAGSHKGFREHVEKLRLACGL